MTRTIALDWEGKTLRGFAAFDGQNTTVVLRESLPSGSFFSSLPPDTRVVVEAAHFGVRTDFSVAQVYRQEELDQIIAQAQVHGVDVVCFPERLTRRASVEAGFVEAITRESGFEETFTDKTRDAEAIWKFVHDHPQVSLMRVRTQEDRDRGALLGEIQHEMSGLLNVMRPDYAHPLVEQARSILHDSLVSAPQDAVDFFDLKVKFKGKPNERLDFSYARVMSVFVAVFDRNGNLRTNPHGKFIGMRTVWGLLGMHPFRGPGSTARSNLMYHGLKNFERKGRTRAEYRTAVRWLIKTLRDSQ